MPYKGFTVCKDASCRSFASCCCLMLLLLPPVLSLPALWQPTERHQRPERHQPPRHQRHQRAQCSSTGPAGPGRRQPRPAAQPEPLAGLTHAAAAAGRHAWWCGPGLWQHAAAQQCICRQHAGPAAGPSDGCRSVCCSAPGWSAPERGCR